MQMTLADRSNYFKGLLLLTRKDNIIANEEKAILLRLGNLLQFNREFCENTIRDLLNNPHFDEEPPQFSNQDCAQMFLRDGIMVAFADHSLHEAEYEWMQEVAKANDIPEKWLADRLTQFMSNKNLAENKRFEVENYASQLTVALPLPA